LALAPPTRSVRLLAEDERLKLGAGMLSTMVVVLVALPEVPVTVTGSVSYTHLDVYKRQDPETPLLCR